MRIYSASTSYNEEWYQSYSCLITDITVQNINRSSPSPHVDGPFQVSCNFIHFLLSVITELYFGKKMYCTKYTSHWRIQGAPPALAPRPPTGSISFIFASVFAKKCTRQRSVHPPPPNGKSWIRHCLVAIVNQ